MCRPTYEDMILHDRLADVLGWEPGFAPPLPEPTRAALSQPQDVRPWRARLLERLAETATPATA